MASTSPLTPEDLTSNFSENLSALLGRNLSEQEWTDLHNFALRGLAPTDVYAFGEYVYGHVPAPHHREMVDFIQTCGEERTNAVILEPRGHAKTTWGNTIYLAWLIARNPHIRVGLISNTAKQANDFSRAIRWTYESNDRFKEIFGDIVGRTKWTDVEWLRAGSKHHGSNNVTLYSAGAPGAIISKRFDVILCDDILDEENTANTEQREKVEQWFWKTLKPCLTPDGVVIVMGTRWGEDDLYQKLITPVDEGGKGWRSLIRGAIFEQDGVRQALWPQIWDLPKLDKEREDMGSPMFACSYLNDISGLMAGNVFPKLADEYYFTTLPPERRYTIRMGVDLASSEKERADYTARVTTAEDDDGNFYVLSVVRDKRETHHAEFVVDGWLAHPSMALIIVENQQFQSTLIQELMRDYPHLPVQGKKSDVDKVTRARAVAARYELHKVYHHVSLRNTEFETELRAFPKGHDDMVDALGFSMDLAGGSFFFGSLRR